MVPRPFHIFPYPLGRVRFPSRRIATDVHPVSGNVYSTSVDFGYISQPIDFDLPSSVSLESQPLIFLPILYPEILLFLSDYLFHEGEVFIELPERTLILVRIDTIKALRYDVPLRDDFPKRR